MKTLVERMQFVLDANDWSAREWARRAKLAEESHVGILMRRMAKQPDRLAGDIETYAKLAAAASVSLDWLVLGRGTPNGLVVEIADDPRYPSRARVAAAAHWLGFGEAVIRAVLTHNEPAIDPGYDYWLRLLQLKQIELARALPAPESEQR